MQAHTSAYCAARPSTIGFVEQVTTWDEGYYVLSTGSRVYMRHAASTQPDAEPAVAVHGLGGSSSNWTALLTDLRADFDVWAFDLPGFGDSPPGERHAVEAYVAEVVAYLEQFDRPVHVVGNSMGGLIAVLVAASRPDLVATLTLLAPAMPRFRLPAAGWAMAALAIPGIGTAMLNRVKDLPQNELLDRMALILFGDPSAVDPADFAYAAEQRLRWAQQPHSNAVLISSLRSLIAHLAPPRRRHVWAAARRVMCPTLVMLSGRDALLGPHGAAAWRRSLPRAHIVRLPSSGHVAMMEHPEAVGGLIRGFVRGASTARTHAAGMSGGVAPLRAK